MRLGTQVERHNKNQVELAIIEGKRRRERPNPAIHEAAVMAGEMVARLNNHKKTTAEEVIKSYRPDYLKKRGKV